jgi:hypothetical protein
MTAGRILVCSDVTLAELGATTNAAHIITGDGIRQALIGRDGPGVDPRGLRVRGARIIGSLDLEGVDVAFGLDFEDCWFDEAIAARGVSLARLRIHRCRLPGLTAPQAVVRQSLLITATMSATPADEDWNINLPLAKVGGTVRLTGSTMTATTGHAVNLELAEVGSSVFLKEAVVESFGDAPAVNLFGCRINGNLVADGARITSAGPTALHLGQSTIKGNLLLRRASCISRAAQSDGAASAVVAHACVVDGTVEMDGTYIRSYSAGALSLEAAKVGSAVLLRNGFAARASGPAEAVRLYGSVIGGSLDVNRATLISETGSALNAVRSTVNGPVLGASGFRAMGGTPGALVDLRNARAGADVNLSGSVLANTRGPAFDASWGEVAGSLALTDAGLTGGGAVLSLVSATISGDLNCARARIAGEAGPAIEAPRLQVGGIVHLPGFIRGGGGRPAVNLFFATVGRYLMADRCRATSAGTVLNMGNIRVSGPVLLRDVRFQGGDHAGPLVALDRARVGSLEVNRSHLANRNGAVLTAHHGVVEGEFFLGDKSYCAGVSAAPAVQLHGTTVAGSLAVVDLRLTNTLGRVLSISQTNVQGDLRIGPRVRIYARSADGAVDLAKVAASGDVIVVDSSIVNGKGPVVALDGLQAGGDVVLEQLRVESLSVASTVDLRSIRCRQMLVTSVDSKNADGGGLFAYNIAAEADVTLDKYTVTSGGRATVIEVDGLTTKGSFDLLGINAVAESGAAVELRNCKAGISLRLGGTFASRAGSADPTLYLRTVTAGEMNFVECHVRNKSGPAVSVDHCTVEESVFLSDGFTAEAYGEDPAVSVRDTRIGRALYFAGGRSRAGGPSREALELHTVSAASVVLPVDFLCHHEGGAEGWIADGRIGLTNLSMADLEGVEDDDNWYEILTERATRYRPQPYQKIASLHRSLGHESTARRFLVAQQRDLRRRGNIGGFWRRVYHGLLEHVIGYGYQTWRAVAWLFAIVVLAMALGLVAGAVSEGGKPLLVHTQRTGSPGTSCTNTERIGVGLDRGLPLINTGIRDRCEINMNTHGGQVALALAWVLQFFAWALGTLVVAGYTGLVRKT